ncbi:MAG: hypothetical protein K2I49_01400 [Ureaplasma sp.]|nr:hypothetical protein [Ureaplasma sp.]
MNNDKTYFEIVQELSNELSIIKELNFTNEEIDKFFYDLINYRANELKHSQNKDFCDVNHFKFIRDEENNIRIVHINCIKQKEKNTIKSNLIICNYLHNDDFIQIINNDQFNYLETNKRNKFLKYIGKNMKSLVPEDCFLFGEIQSGKSYTGFYLLKNFFTFHKDKKIAYINAKVFCSKIYEGVSSSNWAQINEYIDILLKVDYLFIDDLGTEKQTSTSIDKLIYLLKERLKAKKPIFIISSKNIIELKRFYTKFYKLDKDSVDTLILYLNEVAKKNYIEIDKVL